MEGSGVCWVSLALNPAYGEALNPVYKEALGMGCGAQS
jgi:hypothetical protein